jgi:3-hydroxyisobutyrate dehydrogenase-like beta-hydroxyacid dehydrogenase
MTEFQIKNKAYKVGVVGAGRMGMSMIGHLCKKGFEVVVCESDPSKHEKIRQLGAQTASLSGMAGRVEFVLICVGFDHQVQELVHPDGEMLSHLAPSAIVAVLSTVHPNSMLKMVALAKEHDVYIVDATVCRGGRAADKGELLTFIGADAHIFDRLKPVVSSYSSDVVHSGGVGTAQAAKAANNLIMWACLVANHEGLALAKRYGVNTEQLRLALLGSTASNAPLLNWGDQSMAWADDDMEIVAEMAKEVNLSLPQSGLVRELCRSLKPKRYDLDRYGV